MYIQKKIDKLKKEMEPTPKLVSEKGSNYYEFNQGYGWNASPSRAQGVQQRLERLRIGNRAKSVFPSPKINPKI